MGVGVRGRILTSLEIVHPPACFQATLEIDKKNLD